MPWVGRKRQLRISEQKIGRRLMRDQRSDRGQRPIRSGLTARQNTENKPMGRKEKWRLWQMAISAVVLVLVVTVKLIFPETLNRYRTKMLSLMGEDTDFVATFASVGKAVSFDGKLGEAVSDVYTEVFGPAEISDRPAETPGETDTTPIETIQGGETVYGGDNTPQIACMTQQVLGFAYTSPVDGVLTSKFGYREHPVLGTEKFHYGLDFQAEIGTVIRAFADGTVSVVAESSDLGKYVVVVHKGAYSSIYAHCQTITASVGQQVKAGAPIAEVGDTGRTTGPHLHFELMHDTDYLNPIYYVGG